MVDYVHIFDEPNLIAFIEELHPDVHVNGVEYGEECIEAGAVRLGGGRLHLVGRIPDFSTSGLLAAASAGNPR
jgi:D-glycero-beta-D-manno-heptose 1-phosphate adenylyltransferase